MKHYLKFLTAVLILASTSCSSMKIMPAIKDGEYEHMWMGRAENEWEWQISLEKTDDRKSRFRIKGTPLESSFLSGEAFVQSDGSWILHADNLEWFNNWKDGWTRASLAAWGSFKLENTSGEKWSLVLLEPVILDRVESGTIRYGEKSLYGDRSRDLLQRRWSRITVLSDHLKGVLGQDSIDLYRGRWKRNTKQSFFFQAGQYLFPEKYGYPKGSTWSNDDSFTRTEGILWNTTYTENNFSDGLDEIRNSGTMYRDWEEGSSLLYMAYNWQYITDISLTETEFTKKGDKR